MTERNDHQEQNQNDPWERKFSEEEAVPTDNFSRAMRHKKKEREASTLSKVLFFVFLVALFMTIFTIIAKQFKNNEQIQPPAVDNVISVRTSSQSSAASVATTSSTTSSAAASSSSSSAATSVASSSSSSVASSSSSAVASSSSEPAESSSSSASSTAATSGEIIYVVKAGDNLYRIALNHGLTQEELMAYNGLTSTVISVGDELRIPTSER